MFDPFWVLSCVEFEVCVLLYLFIYLVWFLQMVFYQRMLLMVERFGSHLIYLRSMWVLGPRDESIHHFLSSNLPLRACVLSHFSRVQLFVTLWTVACQASLSMGFSRQQHWNMYIIYGERDHQSRLDAWDKCSGLVHWEDPEGLGRKGGGRGDRDGEYM